jgi:hypothetical protein
MNQRDVYRMLGTAAVCLAPVLPAGAVTLRCTQDSVNVGGARVDKHKASEWQVPGRHSARSAAYLHG